MSIPQHPTVGNLEGAAFGLQLDEMGEERPLRQWMQLRGDVVVDALDQGEEVGRVLARQRGQYLGFAAQAVLDERLDGRGWVGDQGAVAGRQEF